MKKTKVYLVASLLLFVVAILGVVYFIDGGSLQGCFGRSCFKSNSVDLNLSNLNVAEIQYGTQSYFRLTLVVKNNSSSSAAWKVMLNDTDYTSSMAWKSVSPKTDSRYSFDIMQSVACDAATSSTPSSISLTIDPDNTVKESKEDNNAVSINFPCKITASISSVAIGAMYNTPTIDLDSGINNQNYSFDLVTVGKNLDQIKSMTFDDPTVKVNLSNLFTTVWNGGNTTVHYDNEKTASGLKKVTYTDVSGVQKSFFFTLKLPMETKLPIVSAPSGTLSLSNPKVTWDNPSKKASQYAYVNGKFVPAYSYFLYVVDDKGLQQAIVEDDGTNSSCFANFYPQPDLNSQTFGKTIVCNSIAVPAAVLSKLQVGGKYYFYLQKSDHKPSGGDYVFESAEVVIPVTIVK